MSHPDACLLSFPRGFGLHDNSTRAPHDCVRFVTFDAIVTYVPIVTYLTHRRRTRFSSALATSRTVPGSLAQTSVAHLLRFDSPYSTLSFFFLFFVFLFFFVLFFLGGLVVSFRFGQDSLRPSVVTAVAQYSARTRFGLHTACGLHSI
jgi:hypothetical protein